MARRYVLRCAYFYQWKELLVTSDRSQAIDYAKRLCHRVQIPFDVYDRDKEIIIYSIYPSASSK